VVGCEHRASDPPLRRGRRDGSDPNRVFCSECAEALVETGELESDQ
jgi:hypothetical protein